MRPTEKNFYEWNEEHAAKHDLDKFYNHPNALFRYIENKRIRKLIEFAHIHEVNKVLEIGCGAGHILERISSGKLYGIDISQIQIDRAELRVGHKATLIRCPGECIPYEDRFFDTIICTEVFEHVLNPLLILKEMNRLLKDEGVVSLSVPNENLINITKTFLNTVGLRRVLAPRKSGWDLASNDNLDEWHLHKFSLRLISRYCDGVFRIQRIARIPFFFLPYRYVLQLLKLR